ncbi:MAG: efflux RND transporter periplasmic adaptor subunit [Verrucomicrobia bacterium]|nr:efflux RND transporter periplasmic adaptor subunit [Verrucomicrobiota bacterium]MCH8510214.1 efflux RND transporter periplasmic adaptor subunit [Kiritimatiellia bacterium]
MNTTHKTQKQTRKGLVFRPMLWIGGLTVIALVAGGLAMAWFGGSRENAYSGLTREVRRGNLTISVTESGALRNRDQVVVSNRVEGRTTILWIIEEGQQVAKGDLLVELDSSDLEDRLIDREISVQNAEANYIRAQQSLEVTKSRTQSEIAEAELALRFAKLDLEKYMGEDGEYAQELDRVQSDIDIAQEEMLRAQQEFEDSQALAANEFITPLELERDRLSFQRAEVNLRLARGRLQLLENYAHDRKQQQLESDVERARERLERTRMNAHADIVQAQADYKAREQELQRQKQQLTNLQKQIELCRIVAPAAGMVVYETSANPGRRGNREPLEAGQEVRERQELIYLPSSSGMTAEVQVHESALERIDVGMPARITVDARPGQSFAGRVRRIAPMPDAQSIWLNPDLTVYSTLIDVDADNLRTGMSARAEIIIQELEDVLYIPIQSVVRHNGSYYAYVLDSRGVPRAREVQIGLDNNVVVHIREGLEVGEKILLAPPLSDRNLEETESPRRGGGGGGGGRPGPRT